MPRSLGINRNTYPAEQFYSDVQAYIQFKTPSASLRTLADDSGESSPLAHARRLAEQLHAYPDREPQHQRLSHNLRLFGCMVRATIRDQVKDLRGRVRSLEGCGDHRPILVDDLRRACERFLDDLAMVLTSWRRFRAEFQNGYMPRVMRETYEYVDEYLSLNTENKLTALLRHFDDTPDIHAACTEARARTRNLIVAERRYREGAGYPTLLRTEQRNEAYVYRLGTLKKFLNSVLWLEIRKEKEGQRLINVGAAIAAGAAMFFALLATILHSTWWALNTWSFVLAATITYILKDRVKDWFKNFLAARVTRWLFDYSVEIRDPITDKKIGRCREALSFLSITDTPPEVLALRRRDAKVSIEAETKPEVVIKYEKDVRLNGKEAIDRLHSERFEINDIIRFSLTQFLVRADDPFTSLPLFDEDLDRVRRHEFHKVYHLNLVIVLRSPSVPGLPAMKRVRVVFDKHAIHRLEEVE